MTSSNTPAQNENELRDTHGLEFPDWNGTRPHRSRMSFEQAVHWNDEMLSLFPSKKTLAVEAKRRCHAEFIL